MRNAILICLILIVPKLGLSQSDFRKGFIITNAPDTIYGFINYRESDKASEVCEFKESKDHSVSTYNPDQIVAYGFVGDKFFESRKIKMKGKTSFESIFLEVIVKGVVSLYRYKDTFWVDKDGQALQQLINEERETEIDGKRGLKKTNQHIGTLNILLFDCPEIRSSLQRGINLQERPLANLIVSYNTCKGVSAKIFKEKKPWVKTIFGMTGGVNVSKLEIKTDYPELEHLIGTYEISTTPAIGFSFDLLSPRLSESFAFNANVLYMNPTYYHYSIDEGSARVERNYLTLELQQLKVPFGFRYTFQGWKVMPYVSAGISTTFHLKSNFEWLQEVESHGVVTTHSSDALEIKNRQLGYWGGIGILRSINNKLNASLEIRYEQTNGVTPFSIDAAALRSTITNFQVFLGIKFK